jgi:hypothetical protein
MAGSFRLWETKSLHPNLFRAIGLDTMFVLVKLVLVLPVVARQDRDLLVRQTGDPADDFVVGGPVLEIRNQVVNRNPAAGQLKPTSTINKTDVFLHTILFLGASIVHDHGYLF